MSKLISGIAFLYVIFTLLASFVTGGGGINSTVLTVDMTAVATSATVQNTAGFLGADKIVIGGETMNYASKDFTHFLGITRVNGVAHSTGGMVYNQQTSILNNALGYNVSSITSSSGGYALLLIPIKFFTTTLPNLVSGNTLLSLLPAELQWLGYIWLAMTMGIVISIGIALIWVASNLIGRIL